MLKSFFATSDRALYAWLMLAWLLFIGWYNVQILVYYNAWNREFYDAIQTLQEERFWQLFWSFDPARFIDFITFGMDEKTTVPSFLEILIVYIPMATYATCKHSVIRLLGVRLIRSTIYADGKHQQQRLKVVHSVYKKI